MTLILRADRRWWILSTLVLMAAFGLRVWDLSARPLWFDEAMEFWVATASLTNLASSVRAGIQDPPLYSALLHFWMLINRGEQHLRLLSVFFSLIAVAGALRLGRRLGGTSGGLISGGLMAIMTSQLRYAQEVGQYALMGATLMLSTIALQRLANRVRPSDYVVWAALAVACAYSYYGTVIAVVVPFLVVAGKSLLLRRWRQLAASVVTLACYGAAVMPLVVYFLPGQLFRGPTAGAFQASFTLPMTEVEAFLRSTQQLVAFQFTGWPWTSVPEALPAVLLLVAVALPRRPWSPHLGWLAATWVTYYLASRFNLFPYGFRYGLILAPMIVTQIGRSLSQAFSKSFRGIAASVVLAVFVIVCAVSLPNRTFHDRISANATWPWPETEDLRPVAEYWFEQRAPGQPTYIYYGATPAFGYYLQQLSGKDAELPPNWFQQCWRPDSAQYCRRNEIYYGRFFRDLSGDSQVESIRNTLPARPVAFWIVFAHVYSDENARILSGFAQDYAIALSYIRKGASVYLMRSR